MDKNIDILIGVAEKGGVENVVNMTAVYLMEQGYYVRVVQIVWEGVTWTDDSIPFYPLIRGKDGHNLAELSDAYQEFLRSGEGSAHIPDLVLGCAWPYMTYIAKNVAVNLNLPYRIVSWLHAPVQRYIDAGFGGYDSLRFADAHFAISRNLAADLRRHLPEIPVLHIHNPVVLPPVQVSEIKDDTARRGDRLYFIGRIAVEKRLDVIVRALALSGTKYQLTIIGDGYENDMSALKRVISETGMQSQITLAGWQEHPWEVVRDAAAVILASEYEGFPLVLIEALSRGIPVISTPVDGVIELVRPGENGYLFPFGDVDSLAKILDTMEAGLFPVILPENCMKAAMPYQKETALQDFALKLKSVSEDD